jgi:methylthioribulose-1-phosphate dehydratase
MARRGSADLRSQLVEVSRRCYLRGWALGTSGNFSAVVSRQPLRLAITPSAVPKGRLAATDILVCDAQGAVVGRSPNGGGAARKPSAETLLHLEIARIRQTGAVFHTHSIWTTVLSDLHAAAGGIAVEGYEMLKGLTGVSSHRHREWIPIVENDQNMPRLARRVRRALERFPETHAVLLRRHGLYTWGDTLEEAERHIEILEFLFESIGRRAALERTEGHLRRRGPRARSDEAVS